LHKTSYSHRSFKNEQDAFKQFNNVFPSAFLLVDTYDTTNAIKKIIKLGIKTDGTRLDSGNLYNLSIEARNLQKKYIDRTTTSSNI
jgi:nicotinate phosphoribosyltransferase